MKQLTDEEYNNLPKASTHVVIAYNPDTGKYTIVDEFYAVDDKHAMDQYKSYMIRSVNRGNLIRSTTNYRRSKDKQLKMLNSSHFKVAKKPIN